MLLKLIINMQLKNTPELMYDGIWCELIVSPLHRYGSCVNPLGIARGQCFVRSLRYKMPNKMVQRTTSKKKNTENARWGFGFISGTGLFFFCLFVLFPVVGEVTWNFDFPWYVWYLCFALLRFYLCYLLRSSGPDA